MKKMDKDGLILCEMQGRIFEQSLELSDTSSEIFMRRFMNSDVAEELDSAAILDDTITIKDIFNKIDDSYGKSEYGSFKYHPEILFWIGYVYRYFSYTYDFSSKRVYGMLKPRWLKNAYFAYHTLDCSQAIERMLEERGINLDYENSNEKLLELIKEVVYENELILSKRGKHNINAKYKNKVVALINVKQTESGSNLFDIEVKGNKSLSYEMEKTIIKKFCKHAKDMLNIKELETKVSTSKKQRIALFEDNGFVYKNEFKNSITLCKALN